MGVPDVSVRGRLRPVGARERTAGGGLDVRREGGTLHVRLVGSVDLAVRDRDAPALWVALDVPGVAAVEVDVAAVAFMDSSGLSVLVRLARDAAERGVPVHVGPAVERVEDLLEQTGVRAWMAGLTTS